MAADDFRDSVKKIVASIPSGRTMTYKEVAAAAGRPRAWRAVGAALKGNYDPAVPCHRVIRSDGRTGGYNRGSELKRGLLEAEGAI